MTGVRFASASDTGHVRTTNEDVCLVDESAGIALVADGLGGHSRGEVASAAAAAAALSALRAADTRAPDEALLDAILRAHAAVRAAAAADPAAADMGTTLVLVWWPDDTESMWYVHVGDSRAYLLHGAALRRLTVDHTIAGQAARSGITFADAPDAYVAKTLTQALGPSGSLAPDVGHETVTEGDRVLLCSDGLTDMLNDEQIAACLQAAATPKSACADLVRAALRVGGVDNVTVVVAEIVGLES